jgi:hypothetical protein
LYIKKLTSVNMLYLCAIIRNRIFISNAEYA